MDVNIIIGFVRFFNEKYNYLPELENLNQKITIVYRSEKLQTILVSQLESYSRQIPLNIIDCGPVEEEERSLGLAVQKLDAITKNLVILDQTEPEIFEDVGDLNSEACPLDLVPLQDLLTDYCQEVCDRERAINILKKIREEKASFKVQKEQLNNLTSVYKQSRQSFEDKLRNLKFELTTTKKKLNEAEERIRKLQDDLSDAQNASFLRATKEKFAKLIEEYNQKFVKLEEEKNYFWESFLVIQDKLENFRKIKLEALAFLVGKPKKRRSSAPVPKATKFFSQPMRKSASATTTPLPKINTEYGKIQTPTGIISEK
ncbi:5150_t:CDS:2 [Racocetra fulgida]|uniref:5150_t:CDS:1 n=1 Tax=Racocetra fulgida TaxID=60492 RepID=A0A9N9DMV8_9GLOM|nr:5150_t:CDS:2 [Racocetra fulgida]